MTATQEEIDDALLARLMAKQQQVKSIHPEKVATVNLKAVAGATAIGGLLLAAVFKFWFSAVSALPFTFTQDWHDRVQHEMEVAESKGGELEVLKANQVNMQRSLEEEAKDLREIRDEIRGLRGSIENYMRLDAERHQGSR